MTNREIDAAVAEHVMGWVWYHDSYTYSQGHDSITSRRSILCPPEQFEQWELKYGKSGDGGDNRDAGRCPNYTSDPSADYAVLCEVRGKRDADFCKFLDAANEIWEERINSADERFGDQEPWSCYLPGDYSRAALAALGVECNSP